MRILGDAVQKEVVTHTIRPVIKTVCDKCGKELTHLYADVTTNHNRWGNDSIDSLKHYQLCFECAQKLFLEYSNDPEITDCFEYQVVAVGHDGIEVEVKPDGNLFYDDYDRCQISEASNK